MEWQSCPYTLPLVLNAVVCAAVAVFFWGRRPAPGAILGVWAMVGCAEWSFAEALQSASANLSGQFFWFRAADPGVIIACVSFLTFGVEYRGRTSLTHRRLGWLLLPAVVLMVLDWTNWHQWSFRSVRLDHNAGFAMLVPSLGPAGLVWVAYIYALLAVGLLLLLQLFLRLQHVYRAQIIAVTVAVVVPAFVEGLWVMNLSPLGAVDMAPFAFAVTGIALTAGLFRYRLGDIAPAARDAVIENMSDGLLVLDGGDRIVDLNSAAQRIVGRAVGSAIGLPIAQVLPMWSQLASAGAGRGVEVTLVVAGQPSSQRDYELRVSPVRRKGGELTGRVVLLRDITEEKQTRETLRQTEETSRLILDSIEDGYYEIDLAGTFTRVTKATAKIIGVPRAEVLGHKFAQLTDAAGAARLAEIYSEVSRTGEAVKRLDYVVATLDGRTKYLEASASLIRDAAGKPVGFRGIMRDMTERKRAEQELQQAKEAAEAASQAKGAFLATVSHELRTPLTSVLGFAKLIKRRLGEVIGPAVAAAEPKVQRAVKQVADNVDIIVAEGERLTTLINDVLDLAKIESGRVESHTQPVAVAEVIERAVATTTSLSEQKGLTLRTEIDEALPQVVGDPDALVQVVINLISNALKFTPAGSVTCQARRVGDAIEVRVSDTGIGIARQDQDKVFEQFVQLGDTLTGKPTGTGLGLPICKQIVEHHGGRIWLESTAGRGSTFAFTLPIDTASQEHHVAAAPHRRAT